MTQAGFNLDNTGIAFALVFVAGLSTALGAAVVFHHQVVKIANKPILAAGLGFSGGVMLYVSFIEIFFKSLEAFQADKEEKDAYFSATVSFFAGMVLLRLVACLVHMIDRHHHSGPVEAIEEARELSLDRDAGAPEAASGAEEDGRGTPEVPPQLAVEPATDEATKAPTAAAAMESQKDGKHAAKAAKLQQMGLNTAVAIAIHNFPEGLATFVATLADPTVGVTLAIAIGVHNIPEGLCVALPIYYSTQSRLRGFLFGLLSGISEPIGAFVGWLIIKSTGDDMNQLVYGILFGLVAGMMVMIVVLELLPTAFSFDPADKYVTHSTMAGMGVMALSLCLFKV